MSISYDEYVSKVVAYLEPDAGRALRGPRGVERDAGDRRGPTRGAPMNAREAFARLRRLGVPAIRHRRCRRGARALDGRREHHPDTARRAGLVMPVRHGTWWVDGQIDPYRLARVPDRPARQLPLASHRAPPSRAHRADPGGDLRRVSGAVRSGSRRGPGRSPSTTSHRRCSAGFEETATGVRLASAEKALFDFALSVRRALAALHVTAGARAAPRVSPERGLSARLAGSLRSGAER